MFNINNRITIPGEHRSRILKTPWASDLVCITSSHSIRPKLLQLWIFSPTLKKVASLMHTVGSPPNSCCLQIYTFLDRALPAEPFDRREQASYNDAQRQDRRRHSARPASGEFSLGRDMFQSSRSSLFQNGRSAGTISWVHRLLIITSPASHPKLSSKSW